MNEIYVDSNNNNFEYIRSANDYSDSEIEEFKNIVLEAGETSEKNFDKILSKNPIICIYENVENIKAVSAIKSPVESYRNDVFKKAGVFYLINEFNYELGWVVCLPKFRRQGIVTFILKILANYLRENMYATVREQNTPMIKILKKIGFKQSGKPYRSMRGNYNLLLFLKYSDNK